MSTSCLITINNFDGIGVYKHYDGYPNAILPWLIKFHHAFLELRGNDPEYQLLQIPRYALLFGIDNSLTTGWGIYKYKKIEKDVPTIDYLYKLNQDKTITVYAITISSNFSSANPIIQFQSECKGKYSIKDFDLDSKHIVDEFKELEKRIKHKNIANFLI